MISKVYHGHSFYGACRYIVSKPGAEVLHWEGVRSYDYKLMAEDFLRQQGLRPGKEKACFHASLSFYPGEEVSDERMVKLAKEYLQQLGITNTQYSITKHTDRKHPHLHIVANLVNNEGKAISDSYLGLKGKKIAQQLTKEYKFIPAQRKNLHLHNAQALRVSERNRLIIYRAIKDTLPGCRTVEELERKLKEKGITTLYKYKGATSEKQGISFRVGDDIFKGSKVDRLFSLGNLQRTMEQSQKVTREQKQSVRGSKMPASDQQGQPHRQPFPHQPSLARDNDRGKEGESLISILTKPEHANEQTPSELLEQMRKKRKQRRPPGGL